MTVPADPADAPVAPSAPAAVPWWRHALSALVLVALLAIAAVVSDTAPRGGGWQAAIPVEGRVGDTLVGRNIEATVHGVRAADSVQTANGWQGATTGVWIVVDLSVSAVVDDRAALLGNASLRLGDRRYSASDRPGLSALAGLPLSVGVPLTGPLLFEVPRADLDSADGRGARLELGIDSDPRTDSLLVVPVDLTALTTEPSIETEAPLLGDPAAGAE
ncbi:hypothetical protein NVV95_03385 [Herbiconiux sp. CPCC 205716]|uniref:DUF4352 domain-containing protein n=1 Tax=Herbiconiux gentiana TaxID=2970912 RepID=A0ABT2GE74_9MICO|nr:hypothetical protein [Herbiconiux gentiana]MCS5713595.1 hypothetical protein [Herbiconiux gentiana]